MSTLKAVERAKHIHFKERMNERTILSDSKCLPGSECNLRGTPK